MFKIQNKPPADETAVRFGHLSRLGVIVSCFDIRIWDFRVSGKWVRYEASPHKSNGHFLMQNL
jgi:hypothetical protein